MAPSAAQVQIAGDCIGSDAGIHNRRHNRSGAFIWEMSQMPATHFASLFRTTHSTSEQGLSKSEHTMTRHFIQTEHEPAGCFVSPSPQLGMCIRWLSGGLYLDIYDRYGVSRSALYTSCLLERQQRERFSRGFDITGEVAFYSSGKRRHSLGFDIAVATLLGTLSTIARH